MLGHTFTLNILYTGSVDSQGFVDFRGSIKLPKLYSKFGVVLEGYERNLLCKKRVRPLL